jgi:hypothetical protein
VNKDKEGWVAKLVEVLVAKLVRRMGGYVGSAPAYHGKLTGFESVRNQTSLKNHNWAT